LSHSGASAAIVPDDSLRLFCSSQRFSIKTNSSNRRRTSGRFCKSVSSFTGFAIVFRTPIFVLAGVEEHRTNAARLEPRVTTGDKYSYTFFLSFWA
jgi:hypothetical protein